MKEANTCESQIGTSQPSLFLLAGNIRHLRGSRGLSQEMLAEAIGTNTANVTYYEGGGMPKLKTVMAMAKFFGVTVDALVGSDMSQAATDQPQGGAAGALFDLGSVARLEKALNEGDKAQSEAIKAEIRHACSLAREQGVEVELTTCATYRGNGQWTHRVTVNIGPSGEAGAQMDQAEAVPCEAWERSARWRQKQKQ